MISPFCNTIVKELSIQWWNPLWPSAIVSPFRTSLIFFLSLNTNNLSSCFYILIVLFGSFFCFLFLFFYQTSRSWSICCILHLYPLSSLSTLLPTTPTSYYFDYGFVFSCHFHHCVQPFTVQPHLPQLASFPSCSHCVPMGNGMSLVSCSTRTPREYILSAVVFQEHVCIQTLNLH